MISTLHLAFYVYWLGYDMKKMRATTTITFAKYIMSRLIFQVIWHLHDEKHEQNLRVVATVLIYRKYTCNNSFWWLLSSFYYHQFSSYTLCQCVNIETSEKKFINVGYDSIYFQFWKLEVLNRSKWCALREAYPEVDCKWW